MWNLAKVIDQFEVEALNYNFHLFWWDWATVKIRTWDLISDPSWYVFVPLSPLGGSSFFWYLIYFASQIIIMLPWLFPLFLLISFLSLYSDFQFFFLCWPVGPIIKGNINGPVLYCVRQIRPELLWLEREGRTLLLASPPHPFLGEAGKGFLRNLSLRRTVGKHHCTVAQL